jgi:hypothetical protein
MDAGSVIGAIGSILTGGATGVIGAGLSRFADYKLEKLRMEHSREETRLQNEQIRIEGQVRTQVAEVEAAGEAEVAGYSALSASYQADAATYLAKATGKFSSFFMGMVDWVRGMTRPVVTGYLITLTTWIAFQLYGLVGGLHEQQVLVSEGDLVRIWWDVINVVLYLTSAAVLWWFGSRPKAPSVR